MRTLPNAGAASYRARLGPAGRRTQPGPYRAAATPPPRWPTPPPPPAPPGQHLHRQRTICVSSVAVERGSRPIRRRADDVQSARPRQARCGRPRATPSPSPVARAKSRAVWPAPSQLPRMHSETAQFLTSARPAPGRFKPDHCTQRRRRLQVTSACRGCGPADIESARLPGPVHRLFGNRTYCSKLSGPLACSEQYTAETLLLTSA